MSGEWIATYRLQLHAGFPLEAAARMLPYLAALGISHVYLSPCLQAVPGSHHGYDVTDPLRINSELGGEAAWSLFVRAAREHGVGVLLDIVPNHMAVSARNPWWDDLLAHGPFSEFAGYYDIHPDLCAPWRIHLPLLGKAYGEALQSGELRIEAGEAAPRVRYFDSSWPLGPRSWGVLLGGTDAAAQAIPSFGDAGPPATPSDAERERYRRGHANALRSLAAARASGELAARVDAVNADVNKLHAVLEQQFYSLHGCKVAGEVINYRRFFDVNTLVGLRIDRPNVFAAAHVRIAALVADGDIGGLRVDHPDGLRDPLAYLEAIRRLLPNGRIYVEKILDSEERLQADWPVDGTVGYEFMTTVDRLWMDAGRLDALTAVYSDFTGHSVNLTALVREKKRAILETKFLAELERLTAELHALAQRNWRTRDLSRRQLREALARVTTGLTVYRTYRTAFGPGEDCRRLLVDAVQSARAACPDIESNVFDFLLAVLTREPQDTAEAEFMQTWQQLCPAVFAKGVEDTTFYCFDRLVSCNEVGSQPSLFGISMEKFHEFCHFLAEHWPHNLLASSTHDNKRSEDVRARISLLSEIPERFGEALHQWSQANAAAWQHRTPDRHAEYLLYQTLLGAWPMTRDRCWQYMLKACREAKINTSWQEPNRNYEELIRQFVDALFDSPAFAAELEAFLAPLILPGRINSLAQTLIKMTAPGIPDFYQGTELWDLSLVDPDNRRPVDFGVREILLERARNCRAEQALEDWDSGLPKLWLIRRVLELRGRRPQDFAGQCRYQPLVAQGTHLGRLLAFQRGDNLITVVPRFAMSLRNGWEDTRLPLPDGAWSNCLTDEALSGEIPPDALFRRYPVALLVRDGA
jgi:(1->4)-alpha-D-glucan 1-alpha-D-glucosylmutase